jgi:FtsP/CotA-like multicopper oxidase with cupredoxin domain
MHRSPVVHVLALCLFLVGSAARGQTRHAGSSELGGRTRQYFIAADEVDWTYIPSRGDQALTGAKDDFGTFAGSKGMLDPNATTYRKTLYREYVDSSFRTLKGRPDAWAHLGNLGPLLRAEVGDTIKVVFRNHATRPYSMHPHGVFYRKDSEGLGYLDGTTGADRRDDAVPPSGTHVYLWTVPERAGPAHGDGSSVFWSYHSHVNEGKDVNSGLRGPIIITRRGMARADGSPKDVDREFVTEFALYDETLSWFFPANVERLYGSTARFDSTSARVMEFHHFFGINGYLEGNGPMLTMREGDRVRWYVFSGLNEENSWDIHSPHWHGQTLVASHMRTDMLMLTPMMSAIADMIPDDPGIWLLHCHMPGHYGAGMYTRFTVLPSTRGRGGRTPTRAGGAP